MRKTLEIDPRLAVELAGGQDRTLRRIADAVQVGVFLRGNELTLDGDPDGVARAQETVQELLLLADRGHALDEDAVEAVVAALDVSRPAPAADGGNGAAEPVVRPAGSLGGDVVWRHRGKQVAAKTATQRRYIDAIRENTVTFGIGPAGTGKTYLAVAMATRALDERLVSRIILTRPAVEAGERLGFLPGDLMAKVDPYLRPLFDALYDMMDAERVAALLERGAVEVAPLAFMRGRTLNDSFVILDEAQNTSPEQMKMFLTRLGFGSKMCVTGDITQIDLARGQASGLVQVQHILSDIPDIQIVRFGAADVVRHHLVQRIVNAYDDFASSHRPPVGDGGE